MRLLIFFIIVILIKFSLNYYNYMRIKKLHKYFEEFIQHKRTDMNLYRQEVLSLFKKAGVKDVLTPIAEPIGFSQIANATVSVFSMFPSLRPLFAGSALNMFEEAEGVFKKNMINSINPIYWIELILFLPQSLLKYLGLNADSLAFKLWNIFLTFVWWVICTLITLFQPEIKQIIIKLMGNL